MMYWLASLHGIRGMLYWSVDHWAAECGRSSSVNQHPPACRNISRLSGSARTNFVNNAMDGDGTLVYPGTEGMISSIRLEAITDGIEDWQLFGRLGVTSNYTSKSRDLLQRVLTNDTNGMDWNSSWWRRAAWDPSSSVYTELESVRRQAAHRVIDAMVAKKNLNE